MQVAVVLLLDVVLTLLACNVVGPAASKWTALGLPGWAMRAPFYVLRLSIGPAVLLIGRSRRWFTWGVLIGTALTLPLGFLSVLPACPFAERFVNVGSGALQGIVLAWVGYVLVDRKLSSYAYRR